MSNRKKKQSRSDGCPGRYERDKIMADKWTMVREFYENTRHQWDELSDRLNENMDKRINILEVNDLEVQMIGVALTVVALQAEHDMIED